MYSILDYVNQGNWLMAGVSGFILLIFLFLFFKISVASMSLSSKNKHIDSHCERSGRNKTSNY